MPRDKHVGRDMLVTSAALQDHLAQRMRLPDRATRSDPRRARGVSLANEVDGELLTDKQAAWAHGTSNMSLAQRMGLASRPPPALTTQQWLLVLSDAYDNGRLTHPAACAICREAFKGEEQAVTSCGHCFHLRCIRSFEAYQKRGQTLADASGAVSCPLCREPHYERVSVGVGARHWRKVCATKLQSAWRGYAQRLKFARDILAKRPPPIDTTANQPLVAQRRQFAWLAAVVRQQGREARREARNTDREVDDLLHELDESTKHARRAMEELERRLASAAGGARAAPAPSYEVTTLSESVENRGAREFDGALLDDDNDNEDERDRSFGYGYSWLGGGDLRAIRPSAEPLSVSPALAPHPSLDASKPPDPRDVDWDFAVTEALRRADDGSGIVECPICMCSLPLATEDRFGTAAIAWLSCSHVYHAACLDALEAFAQGKADSTARCAVCRTAYARRDM